MRPWFSVQFHPEACGGPTDTAFLFKHFIKSISEPESTRVTTIPYAPPIVRRKVLVLGSGGLTIGQAGEFDYSGSQAIKALRESGVRRPHHWPSRRIRLLGQPSHQSFAGKWCPERGCEPQCCDRADVLGVC